MNYIKGFFIMPGWDKSVCNFYTANTLDIKYGRVKRFSFVLLFDFERYD